MECRPVLLACEVVGLASWLPQMRSMHVDASIGFGCAGVRLGRGGALATGGVLAACRGRCGRVGPGGV
jgi:hypothetical protein